MDAISTARLKTVHPLLARAINTMSDMLEQEKIFIRVTQALRSWNQQAALYAKGRDADGNVINKALVVTNAKPGHGWHEFGLAVDVCPGDQMQQGWTPDWNVGHPQWKRIVAVGISLGLESGSTWRTFVDYPHFQMTGIFPVSPTDEVRQLFADGGTVAIWREAYPDQIV